MTVPLVLAFLFIVAGGSTITWIVWEVKHPATDPADERTGGAGPLGGHGHKPAPPRALPPVSELEAACPSKPIEPDEDLKFVALKAAFHGPDAPPRFVTAPVTAGRPNARALQ